ncbi:MAG: repair protein RecN [Actinomycetota bacterium]|jgi:DNA repair protein RecN (Recombination protein N)|nr:repair protein RecN [Actinomycetota bacterium]
MLTDLAVENLGVIETASLTLEPGCSALTGETGAGKTLLVNALSLLAGGRGDPGAVRPGAREARVEGRFVLAHGDPVAEVLVRNGIIDPDGSTDPVGDDIEVVVSRSVSVTASASKTRINGRLVTVGLLGELGRGLLDVVGQHEHQRLFTPTFQRACLDAYSGADALALAREVAEAARLISLHGRSLETLRAAEQERLRELDVLRYEIAEIQAAQLHAGERDRLVAETARLGSSEAIAAAVTGAVEALSSEGGAEVQLVRATDALERVSGVDAGLAALHERATSASREVADIALELRSAEIEPDPNALERGHDRLSLINRLLRKYGRDEEEVLRYLEASQERAAQLSRTPETEADIQHQLDLVTTEAEAKAKRLSKLRRGAAPRLQRATEQVLAELALPEARIEVRLLQCALYEGGSERVELLIDLNGTGESRPLKRVVSGGELSRIALALHLVTNNSSAATMVFDEVDAGVGGEAARSLGRCLARLARSSGSQVLLVTHLPQVAAFADNHYSVSKVPGGGPAVATVVRIDGDSRVSELSRMLAGLPQSGRAQEHARELLELAVDGA